MGESNGSGYTNKPKHDILQPIVTEISEVKDYVPND